MTLANVRKCSVDCSRGCRIKRFYELIYQVEGGRKCEFRFSADIYARFFCGWVNSRNTWQPFSIRDISVSCSDLLTQTFNSVKALNAFTKLLQGKMTSPIVWCHFPMSPGCQLFITRPTSWTKVWWHFRAVRYSQSDEWHRPVSIDCYGVVLFLARSHQVASRRPRTFSIRIWMGLSESNRECNVMAKSTFLYSAVSSTHDPSKRFTLYFLDRPVHSDRLGFSGKPINIARSNYSYPLHSQWKSDIYP